MEAYMETLFKGEALGLVLKVGLSKSYTQLSTQVARMFLHEAIKI